MSSLKLFSIAYLVFILLACGGSSDSSDLDEIVTQRIELSETNNFTISASESTTKYYSLQTEAGISYSIDIINDASSSNQIVVEILAEGYSPVTLNKLRMVSFDIEALETAELIIKIKGSSKAFFRYKITAHLSVKNGLEQDDSSFEPNNSKNAAYPIINGALYSSSVSQNDDYDWYSLDIVKNDTIDLFISNDISSTSFLKAQMYDENKNPISQKYTISHTTNLNEELIVDYTGLVFIRFYGQSLSTPHQYNFSLSLK